MLEQLHIWYRMIIIQLMFLPWWILVLLGWLFGRFEGRWEMKQMVERGWYFGRQKSYPPEKTKSKIIR